MQTTVGQKIFKEFKTKKLVKRYYNPFFWKFLGVVYFPFLTLVSLSEKKYILKKNLTFFFGLDIFQISDPLFVQAINFSLL